MFFDHNFEPGKIVLVWCGNWSGIGGHYGCGKGIKNLPKTDFYSIITAYISPISRLYL